MGKTVAIFSSSRNIPWLIDKLSNMSKDQCTYLHIFSEWIYAFRHIRENNFTVMISSFDISGI